MTIKINNEELSAIIEELAKCEEEIAAARRVKADIMEEVKNKGYDGKAIKQALAIYLKAIVDGTAAAKQAVRDRNEEQGIADFYIDLLGLGGEDYE